MIAHSTLRPAVIILLALIPGCVEGALAQTSDTPKPSPIEHGREFLGLGPSADPAAAARGQVIFRQNCAFCHGANATGAEGPDLVRSSIVLHDEKGETIAPVVLKGRPDRGMPSFGSLTPEQIRDLAEFLHSRVDAAANRFGYKILDIVTGDAKAGEAYFNGAGRCNTCHSATGDLAHIAAMLDPADLQAQFLYPSEAGLSESKANTGAAQPKVAVTLASGESVTGKLKRIDDFTVSLWDQSGNYRCFGRDSVKIQITDPLQVHRELLKQYSDRDVHNVLAYLVTLK